jgi:hypothetical protein
MLLYGLQFEIKNVPREINELSDALSRFPGGFTFQKDEYDMERFQLPI